MSSDRNAKMRKMLADDYGIMSNEELARAIYEMRKANLAIMLAPLGKEKNETKEVQPNGNVNYVRHRRTVYKFGDGESDGRDADDFRATAGSLHTTG